MASKEAWERLGETVVTRRIELGMPKQQQLAEKLGVTRRLLSDIENGNRDNYDPATLIALEQALQWQPGSVQTVLAGGLPLVEDAHGDGVDFFVTLIRDEDMPERQRLVWVAYARWLQRRQRSEREALARRHAEEVEALTQLAEAMSEGDDRPLPDMLMPPALPVGVSDAAVLEALLGGDADVAPGRAVEPRGEEAAITWETTKRS